MGQVSPKSMKERESSSTCRNKNKSDNMADVKNTIEQQNRPKQGMLLLSPEKARDTATWIMTTWSHNNHYTTEDSNQHHRRPHATHTTEHQSSAKEESVISRKHKTIALSTQNGSQKYSREPEHNQQSSFSNSTDDPGFLFESFSSIPASKREQTIATTSLPSTPTATTNNSKSKTWGAMPVPSIINCDLATTCPRDQSQLMSSGSSSTSSVSKDETRSAGSASSKQRKRKERRDSTSDEHDKKLSRSSGCLLDDLPSLAPHKSNGATMLIKQNINHKRRQNGNKHITDSHSNRCISTSKQGDSFSDIPTHLHVGVPKTSEENDLCEGSKTILAADGSSQESPQDQNNSNKSLQDTKQYHILRASCECNVSNKQHKKKDERKVQSEVGSKVENGKCVWGQDPSKSFTVKINRKESSKVSLLNRTDDPASQSPSKSGQWYVNTVATRSVEDHDVSEFSDEACRRASSDAISIPTRLEKKRVTGEYIDLGQGIDKHEKINQLKVMEACIEHHNSSNILSDTPDDGLDLYSTSPISCTSSSSETSEEEDEEHKNHHQQHRKEIDELKKKLEIETTQDNDPELTNETAPNNEKAINYSAEVQLRITYQKETFKGEELQKSASLDIPTESKGENGNDYENPQKLARSPFKDNAGILERYRHLSERSWSSTSSGELSSFDDTKFRPTTSPYHQESPVSWMPTCLSLSRRGSISESNDGASEDGDVLAAKACDADSQFVGTRHLGIINSKGHLDPSHMPRGQKDPESPRRIKLKKLNRELSNIKRKLEELANEFENSPGGYRLSHVEKQKHKPMRKLLSEQSRLKRQIRNCRESNFGDVDDDITSMNNQLASAGNVGNPSQLSVDQTIMSVSRTSSRRSSWSSNRDMAFDDSGISGPSISPSPLQLEYTPTLITTPTTSTSSILSSSPGGSSITSSSSGNSSILSFSSSGESSMSLGDRSSGLASEIDDADDENRSDIVISDNEDSNSIISQTMLSVMKKDFDSTPFREKTSFTDIGIISAVNNSSVSKDVSFGNLTNDVELKNNNNSANRNLESMRNSLIDVEQRLKAQRVVAGRPYDLDAMNPDQLLHEKVDLQSALLQFEHLFGHPETQEEKALVKDVYDRYRSVKRHIRRSSSIRSKDPLELETIPEDLEIPLTLASPQHRINIETHASRCVDINILVEDAERSNQLRSMDGMPVSSDLKNLGVKTDSSISSATIHAVETNLHSMTRYELLQVQRRTREDKKLYRRAIKEKEERLLAQTGRRRLPKAERDSGDATYGSYKLAKAKLKLIEALLSKPGPLLF